MSSAGQISSVMLPLIYMAAIFIYGYIFFTRNKKFEGLIVPLTLILLAFHSLHLILRSIETGSQLFATKFDALSLLAFSIAGLGLFIQLLFKNRYTGFFIIILVMIVQSIASMLYNWEIVPNELLKNSPYLIHVILTILGYTAICISAVYALLYILLNRSIKRHHFGIIYKTMPPLRLLENMSIYSVRIGIISLGFGILAGHLMAADLLSSFWPQDAKVWFSNIIWAGYSLGFITARMNKWRGKWMAYLSIFGFIILIAMNITILFIKDTFHNFL